MSAKTPELICFLGPSLPRRETERELESGGISQRTGAEKASPLAYSIEPPAQQGDIWRALSRRPRVIALIDGIFESAPSVWHHELLDAIDAGVLVFGASSMGALRASELKDRGMIGVGKIFALYRDGLDDDAAVALLHGDAESHFRPLTVPLVNVSHAIEAAKAAKALSPNLGSRMLWTAAAIHYQERTWPLILERMKMSQSVRDRWNAFAKDGLPDLKADDARLCLREAAHAAFAARTSGRRAAKLRAQPASAQVRARRAAQLSAHAKAPSPEEERAMSQTLFIAAAARAAGVVPRAEDLSRAEAMLFSRGEEVSVAAVDAMTDAESSAHREAILQRAGIAEDELQRLIETLALEAMALENAGRFLPDGPSAIEAFRAAQLLRALRRR